MNFSGFIKSINRKEYALTNPIDIREFSRTSYLIIHAFSNTADTLFQANEINQHSSYLDALQIYDYLYYNTRKNARRFGRWNKKKCSPKDLDIIKEYYGYNDAKAVQALSVLTKDQIASIKSRVINGKGGKK